MRLPLPSRRPAAVRGDASPAPAVLATRPGRWFRAIPLALLMSAGLAAGWADAAPAAAAAKAAASAPPATAAPVVTLAPPAPASAPARRAGGTAPVLVRELGGIREYRLANGLQVLLFPDDAQSTTTVNITYRVGSRFESQGEYGMAHLLEHLMFKGTPTHKDLPEEFAQRGMRYNGSTTDDRTNYYEAFNADPASLAWAISMEADRMAHSFIAKKDLDKEMTVVRNEFERGENDPMSVLQQRVKSAAYAWHPYGHATIGPKSDIENVPIANLQAFYHRFYRPDNATLLIAGRFDPERTLALVAKAFAPVARPKDPIPAPWTVEPPQDGERSVVVRRVGGQPMLLAYWHVPAAGHPDSAAILVYELMMSLQPSGRLYKDLVETKLAVAAGLNGIGDHDPGGAAAYAVLPPDADVDAVQKRLLDLVEGRTPVTFDETELARVRDLAANAYRDQMKSPEGLIQQLSNVVGSGDWRLLFQLLEDIRHVSLADVQRVRDAYFKPANRTIGRYLPAAAVERVEIPVAPPLDQRLATLKGPPAVEAGEQFIPTPAALAARAQARTLPSGIVLREIPKRTRGNSVVIEVNLQWGNAPATTPRRGTDLVGALMSEGTPTRTKQQIQDALIRLKAELSINSGNQEGSIFIRAERDTALEVLAMAADLVQRPTFPAPAFERMKAAQVAQWEASRQSLSTLLADAVHDHMNAARHVKFGDPDYQANVEEALGETRATTLDDVKSFYAEYWSANRAQVAVVGAVPDGFDAEVERLFGAWKKPSAPKFERWLPRHVDIAPARFDVQANDKTSAAFSMSQAIALNERDPDYMALRVALHVFGGGTMESRLATRVRRQEGLSYGIAAGLHASWWGDDASIGIEGSFAPQNRDRILAAVREEMASFTKTGATADEVARAKHDLLEGRQQARADDGSLAGTSLFHAMENLDWAWEGRKDAAIAAVTVEQVNAAWRKFVREDAFVVSTAGDFAGAATGGASKPAAR
jgi:zinc protease